MAIAPRARRPTQAVDALPRILTVVAIGITVVAGIRLVTQLTVDLDFVDLASYVAGSHRFLSGQPLYGAWQMQPYVISDASGGGGYVYPPTAALLLAPLLLGPLAWTVWVVGSLAAYALVAGLIIRRELGWTPATIVLVAVLAVHPGLHSLRAGQASVIVGAAFGAMWLTRQSGYLSVFCGLVKATPGIGLLWALRQRERLLLPIVLGVAVALVTLAFGWWQWTDWLIALRNAHSECSAWWAMPSFGCAGVPWVGWLIATALIVVTLRASRDDVAFAALGWAAVLLPIEMHWGYLVIPALACLPLVCHLVRDVHFNDADGYRLAAS
jgi:hypothetical protein